MHLAQYIVCNLFFNFFILLYLTCHVFRYHMYGPSIGVLNVRITRHGKEGEDPWRILWARVGSQGNRYLVLHSCFGFYFASVILNFFTFIRRNKNMNAGCNYLYLVNHPRRRQNIWV